MLRLTLAPPSGLVVRSTSSSRRITQLRPAGGLPTLAVVGKNPPPRLVHHVLVAPLPRLYSLIQLRPLHWSPAAVGYSSMSGSSHSRRTHPTEGRTKAVSPRETRADSSRRWLDALT